MGSICGRVRGSEISICGHLPFLQAAGMRASERAGRRVFLLSAASKMCGCTPVSLSIALLLSFFISLFLSFHLSLSLSYSLTLSGFL